jgi:hypothetical protein
MRISELSVSARLIRETMLARVSYKTRITRITSKNISKFEIYFNDGTGEVTSIFWSNLPKFDQYFTNLEEGMFVELSCFCVMRVPNEYSKGHVYQLKINAHTTITLTKPIENFHAFQIVHSFCPLNEVMDMESNGFIWARGIIVYKGNVIQNLMDDGQRQEFSISNDAHTLLMNVWGENELQEGSMIEVCGRVRSFNMVKQFSVSVEDIKVYSILE